MEPVEKIDLAPRLSPTLAALTKLTTIRRVSRLRFAASGKAEGVRLPSALAPLALLVYVAAMTAYIYAFLHRPDADYANEVGPDEVAILASVVLLHVALGFVIGPLALLAPLLPVVIAIPAGEYPGGWPEGPVWLGLLLNEMFIGLPLVALGVGIRAVTDRRRTNRPYTALGQPK